MSQGTLAALMEPAPLRALLLSGSATIVAGAVLLALRRRRSGPFPIAGLVIAGSAALALIEMRPSAMTAAMGAALLALGGELSDLGLKSLPLRIAATLPGAWLIAFETGLPGPDWVPWLVLLAIALAAPLLTDFGRGSVSAAWGAPLFALSALGIFFTVPDTEEAAVLLTAAAPVALLGWPAPLASLGGAGSYSVVGVTAWIVVWGSRGRETALVGAAACLGLLLAEPVARLLTRRNTVLQRISPDAQTALAVGAAHFLLVVFASRFAGMRPSVLEASVLAGAALFLAVVALAVSRGERMLPQADGEVSARSGAPPSNPS